uniref:Uncharacterized protein n=1 Tax=Anguilla anguilla TaxID=7936 RepID=A0A0E9XJD6_ANGAN
MRGGRQTSKEDYREKRWVLNRDWKEVSESEVRMSGGREL